MLICVGSCTHLYETKKERFVLFSREVELHAMTLNVNQKCPLKHFARPCRRGYSLMLNIPWMHPVGRDSGYQSPDPGALFRQHPGDGLCDSKSCSRSPSRHPPEAET